MWIVDSLEAEEPIREIELQRGVNLVVSPPGSGNAGHGVGKTAFCQLVRFVLEDPLWAAGSSLRDELLHSMGDGAVAARVHVGDDIWTVVKPWQHQKHYRASLNATWKQLARGEVANEHAAYLEALQKCLVDGLPVKAIPGAQQAFQWHHILAWCSRDQNARYQSYYQWRTDGVGFGLPAKSSALLMRTVLGSPTDAGTYRALERLDRALKAAESSLEELRRRPADLLAHVRHRLVRQLDAAEATAFRSDGLFEHPNLLALAQQRYAGYEREVEKLEADRQALWAEQRDMVERRAPLKNAIDLIANQVDQIEAAIAGDMNRIQELRNERASLQQRSPTKCDAGNVLLKDCRYVNERIEQLQFDRWQGVAKHQKSMEDLERDLHPYRERLRELRTECEPRDMELAEIDKRSRELTQRNAEVLRDMQRLSELIEDYEFYENVINGKASWEEIADAERQLETLQEQRSGLELKLRAEQEAFRKRRRTISDRMQTIVQALPRFEWGVFDERHKGRPFRLGPMHSTTFGVVEILAGDIACLLDSASGDSFHPGFLIHDSPREAEMSEDIFWALLSVASKEKDPAYQYIVTTSTRAEKKFGRFVRLSLSSATDGDLLFRKRIGAEEPPLPV